MMYFNTLLLSLCTLIGVGCSDGGESVTPPPPVVVTPPPVEPDPEYGTLLKSGCSQDYEGVKWFQYADGEGGTYVEKDEYSRECGYRRILTLSLNEEAEVGDRFYPVIVDVDYVDIRGDNQAWGMADASTTLGYAERVGRDTVVIYGDGRTGDGIFTLGVEEIQFTIVEEPTCYLENGNFPGQKLDCMGYSQRTSQEHIYYGEDDENIVTWELGILWYDRELSDDFTLEQTRIGPPGSNQTPADDELWQLWKDRVEEYNEVYEKSGVHIRYELKELYRAKWSTLGDLQKMRPTSPNTISCSGGSCGGTSSPFGGVDIILGYGTSYPDTCGVAKVSTYFRPLYPPVSMSECGIYTDLHELGHSVGLAHGPENQGYPASGYIFPEFGHGWNDICGRYDDLMSYGQEGIYQTNETLFCSDVFPNNELEGMAGNRQWTDTAYHLNRVRYLVSLIHDENKYIEEDEGGVTALEYVTVKAQYIEIEVID